MPNICTGLAGVAHYSSPGHQRTLVHYEGGFQNLGDFQHDNIIRSSTIVDQLCIPSSHLSEVFQNTINNISYIIYNIIRGECDFTLINFSDDFSLWCVGLRVSYSFPSFCHYRVYYFIPFVVSMVLSSFCGQPARAFQPALCGAVARALLNLCFFWPNEYESADECANSAWSWFIFTSRPRNSNLSK